MWIGWVGLGVLGPCRTSYLRRTRPNEWCRYRSPATTKIRSQHKALNNRSNQQHHTKTSSTATSSSKKPSTALMKSPNRADTFGSDTTAASTSSKLTWKSTSSSQTQPNKNTAYKPKKPKAQVVQFSDVGRHSNQWLFNDMSISDAVKTLFGKK